MPRQQRETLGEILRSKKFFVYLGMCLLFDFTVTAYCVKDLWHDFYEIHLWGSNGLVMGNCLGFFASNITIISWLLVDENSWLGKAWILLIASVSLTICGAYFTVKYFNFGSEFYKRPHDSHSKTNHAPVQFIQFSVWMPILAGINFLQGIIGFIFFILVCMSRDKNLGTSNI